MAGGLAEYFDVDPVLVRTAWVVFCFLTFGFAFLLYIVLAIIMPREDTDAVFEHRESAGDEAAPRGRRVESDRSGRRALFAMVLIVVGTLVLLADVGIFWWFDWDVFWPLVLIGIGTAILIGRSRRS